MSLVIRNKRGVTSYVPGYQEQTRCHLGEERSYKKNKGDRVSPIPFVFGKNGIN